MNSAFYTCAVLAGICLVYILIDIVWDMVLKFRVKRLEKLHPQ